MSGIRREVAVVGGGLTGWATAVGFAQAGFDTVLFAPSHAADRRSTALIGPSVDFIEGLGLGTDLRSVGQAMTTMRLVDDTRRLLRAPTVEFRASEIGRDAFGVNVMNADLMRLLRERAAQLGDRLTVVEDPILDVTPTQGAVVLRSAGLEVRADLAVGADGRNSVIRQSAAIALKTWAYPQSAVVLNFMHDRDHHSTSTEFHTRTGPFTQVPLPGRRSSLVWVEEPATADLLVDVHRGRLSCMVEERMHSILGAVEVEDGIQRFPLSGATVARMSGQRSALVGEAAHVFPPIGAQGLNLGLRDAADLVAIAAQHRDDPGSATMLREYETRRRADVASRTVAVDLLNRSLLTGFLPVQALRNVGLGLLSSSSALRRLVMREGTGPGLGFRRPFGNGRSISPGRDGV